jgi:hypothetical protein
MCEEIVLMSKLLTASTVGALALALASCSESTAPNKAAPRTASVVTTVAVPAVPTAPVTLTTSATESKVAATVPLAALQALVQALGGPVTITMKDVAAKDYSSSLPAGTAALINASTTAAVLQFSAVRSGASLTQESSGTVLYQSGQTVYDFSVSFTPYGQSCAPGTLTGSLLSGGTKTAVTLKNVRNLGYLVTADFPVPLSVFIVGYAMLFECQGVSGSFGG